MKKMMVLLSMILFSISMNAQTIKVTATQSKGSAGKNAELKCNPISLTKSMKILKIEGDCQGLWIVKDNKIIHKFWDNKSPLGTVLAAGTYYVYPNLKPNSNNASVTVTFN